ncbi:MAG: hypothetical protein JJU40_02940 [Rhodobacteraceae bacterium]|nr:hypothetical protein [Paracoccaceae bacterium]
MSNAATGTEVTVRRRRVFYIPGYDPFPPRRYRELYRREGARQAEIAGYEIALSADSTPGPYGWRVRARIEGVETETRFSVLVWTDIVRSSMDRGVLATYVTLVRTFWIYLSTGAMGRLFRLRPGPVITAMYPPVMLLAQLAMALGLGWLAAALLGRVLPAAAGWAVGAVLVVVLLQLFRRIDGKLYVYYLLHDYAFTARHRGLNPPELEARMAEFTAMVAEALREDWDEVLVVGHSSGAHLGVSVLADLMRSDPPPPGGAVLGLLTRGPAVPMQSFLSLANRLRADLHALSEEDRLTWIDVSAPGDGCCYALCDPVCVSGQAGPGKRWPLVISAAFSQTLSPETWRRLKRRFFRLHFQYLCAFDRPEAYDYFAITAGPRTLGARFAGRKPSASRNETVLSPHLSREPL